MSKRSNSPPKPATPEPPPSISRITVAGFKSIAREQSIDIAPLTILAGTNSSGKSSIMQPLLLLKQTLESPFDPGALLLNGPNIKFTEAEQLLTKKRPRESEASFSVAIQVDRDCSLQSVFLAEPGKGFIVKKSRFNISLQSMISLDATRGILLDESNIDPTFLEPEASDPNSSFETVAHRCFLYLNELNTAHTIDMQFQEPARLTTEVAHLSMDVIHVPGLRGSPERYYPVTAMGPFFPGRFDPYTASVILNFQTKGEVAALESLTEDLMSLGLTSRIMAKLLDATRIELLVGRLNKPSKSETRDLVSIADVGLGVSLCLPVLVALHAARPGQLVYLEEPEIHLHPRAQTAMAQVLAKAAMRGVKVVAETHSELLLLGVQTLVAEGKLDPKLVKMHWFDRDKQGMTTITTGELDENGTCGDWPEDFADVSLKAQDRFLSAYEKKHGH